ncbi:MAG: hypothetical protein M0R73_03990 [Dehalococcoidia bacterium]|nr:hypothetical protein [Dehalococcoidia bacterium]
MSFEAGQVYACSNCGAEIQVTRSADAGMAADMNPMCACGQEMNSQGASAQGANPQRQSQGPMA